MTLVNSVENKAKRKVMNTVKSHVRKNGGMAETAREIREGVARRVSRMNRILHENKRTKFITRNAEISMYFFTTRNHRSIKLQSSRVPATHIIQVDSLKTITGIFRYLKSVV